MKTEIELFLQELSGHGYEFKNTDWYDDWERFEDDQLNMVWEMWQASASRGGYKLVPVETLQESLGWACIAEWDSPNRETDEEIRKHKSIIEKAITGAVE